MFAHEYSKARVFLDSALTATDAETLGITAMAYRALGEVAVMEKDARGAERYFSKVDLLCAEMGIPRSCIYNFKSHWYTVPDDRFPAWSSYLARY